MSATWTSRPATSADYPHFARLFPELGVPDLVPTQEKWDRDICRRAIFLTAPDGAVVGYGHWALFEGTAHVVHVIVDPAFRRRGIGAALLEALAARLTNDGLTRWLLNVKADNIPALRLYDRFGFKPVYSSTALSLDWDRTSRLPREGEAIYARPCAPAEDAAIEAAFHKPPGQLAFQRAQPQRVCLRLVDPAGPDDVALGVACFDPAFPGAGVFAVARPTLAAPLLDGIRPFAAPGDTFLRLLVEGDAALIAAFRQAGADVLFELVHMRGAIPR